MVEVTHHSLRTDRRTSKGVTMSIDPIRNAAQALRYWELRHQTMSNNLANVSTSGFKAERVFGELLDGSLVPGTQTDFVQGTLTETGNPLDVAQAASGFLVVDTPQGQRLVRGGALEVDAQSRLTDASGNPVLGRGGPIVIPPGRIEITRSGDITVDQVHVGKLRMVQVRSFDGVEHEAGGRFRVPADGLQEIADVDRDLRQGFVEESNQGAVDGMVEMIEVQRAYASVEKALEALDGALRTVVNDIGRPGR